MRKLSERAIDECRREIEAACRVPIQPQALHDILELVRPNFETMLDDQPTDSDEQKTNHLRRWTLDGQVMRDNGRFVGTFAEFFTDREQKPQPEVGFRELLVALLIVAVGCPAGRDQFKYCQGVQRGHEEMHALIAEFTARLSKTPA